MGLWNSEAHVSHKEVELFLESVCSLHNVIENNCREALGYLKGEMERIDRKAEGMKALASSCRSLYDKTKRLESEISANLSRLKTQLAHTPKVIETSKTDKDGKVTVSKKPNPEYAMLQNMIREQEARLARAKEVAWAVYNKISEYGRVSDQLFSLAADLSANAKQIEYDLQSLGAKTTSAKNSLELTVDSIENYIKQPI